MELKEFEVIIVGVGVAGAAMAYALGKDGRSVLVIEKNLNEPDKLGGELVQPGGYQKLDELDLEDCLEGTDAQNIYGYAICRGGQNVVLNYSMCAADAEGRSFHHGRFVQKLRKKAASLPSVELGQGLVTSLVTEGWAVKGANYRTSSGDAMTALAHLTIVSHGSFSSLRGFLSKPKIRVVLYPIGTGEYRVLIEFPENVPSKRDMAYFLRTIVAPEIPPELNNSFIAAVEEGKVRVAPMRSMPARLGSSPPGAILLGDALSVRHPSTRGGMTVALSDVVTVRDQLRQVTDLEKTSLGYGVSRFYKLHKVMIGENFSGIWRLQVLQVA